MGALFDNPEPAAMIRLTESLNPVELPVVSRRRRASETEGPTAPVAAPDTALRTSGCGSVKRSWWRWANRRCSAQLDARKADIRPSSRRRTPGRPHAGGRAAAAPDTSPAHRPTPDMPSLKAQTRPTLARARRAPGGGGFDQACLPLPLLAYRWGLPIVVECTHCVPAHPGHLGPRAAQDPAPRRQRVQFGEGGTKTFRRQALQPDQGPAPSGPQVLKSW